VEIFEGSGRGGEITQEGFLVSFGDVACVAGKIDFGKVWKHLVEIGRGRVTGSLMFFVGGLRFDIYFVSRVKRLVNDEVAIG
jgi:hypothetical protein